MADELKPCPFCGGEAKTEVDTDGSVYVEVSHEPWCCLSADDTRRWFYAEDGMTASEVAARTWNRRAERTCQIVVSIDRHPASYGGKVHRCSSCGKALPGALFRNGWTQLDYCPRCGARVTEVVRDVDRGPASFPRCPECCAEICPDDWPFCPVRGKKIGEGHAD